MNEFEEDMLTSGQYFKYLNGHMVTAWKIDGSPADLSLHTCPVCLGKIKNPEDALNFASVLSPIQ